MLRPSISQSSGLLGLGSAPQKRARSQLNCGPCWQGKLKCNRGHPACDQCKKRSKESACIYAVPVSKEGKKPVRDVKVRFRRLEGLVISLMSATAPAHATHGGGSKSGSREDSAGTEVSSEQTMLAELVNGSVGPLIGVGSQTSYVGVEHWEAILKEVGVSELRTKIFGNPD